MYTEKGADKGESVRMTIDNGGARGARRASGGMGFGDAMKLSSKERRGGERGRGWRTDKGRSRKKGGAFRKRIRVMWREERQVNSKGKGKREGGDPHLSTANFT